MRDFYGRQRAAVMSNPMDAPMRYETAIVTDGLTDTVYTRFYNTGDDPCAIWKETIVKNSSGNTVSVKHEYAFAPWANRLTATYVPINECWDL